MQRHEVAQPLASMSALFSSPFMLDPTSATLKLMADAAAPLRCFKQGMQTQCPYGGHAFGQAHSILGCWSLYRRVAFHVADQGKQAELHDCCPLGK